MPIVTTLHTVLPAPTPAQRDVMGKIIARSTKVVVMAEKGRELLRSVHDVSPQKIEVIPHGIPDFPFLETHHAKTKFGFSGKTVILTFGLLSPSKGIETVIDAMPEIIKSCPNAVYVILGATHPNLVRDQGEAYRESLTARARELGIEDHVVFFNQFVDQATLLDFISMCDVYVTPYLNEAQMTSGTLAYSFGLGKAVVSTPYWHARELLDDGRGILVPFGDAKAIGSEIAALLTNDVRRHAMRKRAYAASRSMTWAQTAKRYLAAFESAREMSRDQQNGSRWRSATCGARATPFRKCRPSISYRCATARDCSSTPCTRCPTVRTAIASTTTPAPCCCRCALASLGERRLSEPMTASFAAFIQHAWNPDTRRFRNFMSYDRRWLEAQGSEDSHGRTLWALGECARSDTDPSRRSGRQLCSRRPCPPSSTFDRRGRGRSRCWAWTPIARWWWAIWQRAACASCSAERLVAAFHATRKQGLVLVRGCACLRQRAPFAGAACHRRSAQEAAVGRNWPGVPALADGTADHAGWIFQAGRHGKLRRQAKAPQRIRSAARRGSGGDFGLPCRMAREQQRGMEGRRNVLRSIGFWAAMTCRHR